MNAALVLPILGVVACAAIVASASRRWRSLRRRTPRWSDDTETAAGETLRASRDVVGPQLTRLEQAIDAIAVEVERIGENQRFLTKVLASEPPKNAPSAQERRDQ